MGDFVSDNEEPDEGSVKTVKSGGKKEGSRSFSLFDPYADVKKEFGNDEKDVAEMDNTSWINPDSEEMAETPQRKRKVTRMARMTNEDKEAWEKGHIHDRRAASISAKKRVRQIAKESAKKWKERNPRIPRDKAFTAVKYVVDDKYCAENTNKLMYMCGLRADEVYLGKEIYLKYDEKPYACRMVAFAPTEEECDAMIEEHSRLSKLRDWYKRDMRNAARRRKREKYSHIEGFEDWPSTDEEAERKEKVEREKRLAKLGKKWNEDPEFARRAIARMSELSPGLDNSNGSLNEVDVQPPPYKKRRESGHHLRMEESRAVMEDSANEVDEAEALADTEGHGHVMDAHDDQVIDNMDDSGLGTTNSGSADTDSVKDYLDRKWAEYNKKKKEAERKNEEMRAEKARKEEEKRKQMEGKMSDGSKADTVAPEEKDTACIVEKDQTEETGKKEAAPAPKATVATKQSAEVQKNDAPIVTEKDDTVAKAMPTGKETVEEPSSKLDDGAKKNMDNFATLTVKREPVDARAVPLKGILKKNSETKTTANKIDPDVIVLSSDEEDFQVTHQIKGAQVYAEQWRREQTERQLRNEAMRREAESRSRMLSSYCSSGPSAQLDGASTAAAQQRSYMDLRPIGATAAAFAAAARNPVPVSFNPHPMNTLDYNAYYDSQQRTTTAGGMATSSSWSSMQQGQQRAGVASSSSSAEPSLMQLQQSVMPPVQSQLPQTRTWANFTSDPSWDNLDFEL